MSDAVTSVSVEIAGTEITFETGKMAKQASGAVVVRQGDTMVLNTATVGNLRDVDFLPLTVDVEERMYAAGKIPGSFFKREGRSGEKGTLTARMIDRPIRPLFPKGWRYETQLVTIPLSIDHVHPYDILAMNGASAALMISEVPLPTPVGAVRIGKIEGNFVVNPTEEDAPRGHRPRPDRGRHRRGHPDGRGRRQRDPRGRDPRRARHRPRRDQEALRRPARAGREGRQAEVEIEAAADRRGLLAQIQASHGAALDEATQVEDKLERQDATKAVEAAVLEQYSGDPDADDLRRVPPKRAGGVRQAREADHPRAHRRPQEAPRRPRREGDPPDHDRGRRLLPRTHGSALFTRGQTQALQRRHARHAQGGDAPRHPRARDQEALLAPLQLPAVLGGRGRPHARPEAPRHRPRRAGRARAGAGAPVDEDFPYAIRVVSDILESNGSSSMASVCGSSLSLMDAGVPIKAPVAGIAMGLIKEGDDYTVLTDIAGVEDHLGDMDFKVAGTEEGITALQMDIKITGVTFEILRDALTQASEARLTSSARCARIDAPREEMSPYAPRIIHDPDRPVEDRHADRQGRRDDPRPVGGVRGPDRRQRRRPGDHLLRQRRARGGADERIADDQGGRARRRVRGKVVKTTTFGAFVELTKGTDGLMHISNV